MPKISPDFSFERGGRSLAQWSPEVIFSLSQPRYGAVTACLAAAKATIELVQIAGQCRLQSENRVSIHAYGLLAANVATTDQQITG